MNTYATETPSYSVPREWLMWTLATAGGWLLGAVINILVSLGLSMTGLDATFSADPAEVPPATILLLMGLSLVLLWIIGASAGAMQWLVLRRHLAGLQRWAIFTGLGFALGSFAFIGFMGVGVGLLQWLLLRRDLNKTVWWPVINAVAWPLGYLLGGSLGLAVGTALNSPLLSNLLSAVLAGALIGAMTGAVLLWLLRENAALLESLRQDKELVK
jgi:hypothetical protein